VAQLGPEGGEVWALARGDDHRPLRPRPTVESVRERLESDEPLATRPAVLAAAEHALNAALRRPERRGRAVRQVVLRTETEGDGRWERVVTFHEPLVARDRLWRRLESVLVEARLPGPVRVLTVELRRLVPVRGWQGELLPARAVRQERLEEGLRQLKARYGRCPVSQVVQVEPWSRIPERRLALIDLDP
jgi:DNA polymerase-4/protein ImuB